MNKKLGIAVLFALNFLIALITGMAAPFGNVWNFHYEWAGMWGNLMTFGSYLVMGVPAGKLLRRIGYRKSLLASLYVGAAGMVLELVSGYAGAGVPVFDVTGGAVCLNFILYLAGAFIGGMCTCMLNVVATPMIHLLAGGGDKGARCNLFAGSFNSLGQTVTPVIVGALIGTVTARTAMLDVMPLLYAALAVILICIAVVLFLDIPEPRQVNDGKYESSPWHFRHFVLGAVAVFFYTGIEVGIPAELNFYLTGIAGDGGAAIGGAVASIYWLLMLVGRTLGGALNGKITTRTQLSATVVIVFALVLAAILLPSGISVRMPGFSVEGGFSLFSVPLSAMLLALCGLFTSVMWVCIFTLSVEGLGKYTEEASGIFMMMIFGGGVLPFVQDAIALRCGVMNSFYLILAMLLVLLYFALRARP